METDFRSSSRLERVLRSGRFAVTAELNPPDSADPEDVYQAALMFTTVCNGINAVDASGANCHMSSVSICALLTRAGYDPVYQVSCRDRNQFRTYILSLLSPFPDLAVYVDHFCALQDGSERYRTATRWTMMGTHTGPGNYGHRPVNRFV